MDNTKYIRLRTECNEAIADDNLEKCVASLSENITNPNDNHELTLIRGRLVGLMREWNGGRMTFDKYSEHRNQIRSGLLHFVNEKLKLQDVLPTELVGIHERILIVKCKNSPTDWERIFPDTRYTHIAFMKYGEPIPVGFYNPEVVVFDDLNCPNLLGNKNEMRKLAEKMPTAYLLYVGEPGGNPFQDSKLKEDQAIFARMNNANSHITLPARLNELLEFRKNYGPPLTTVILENMKDKLPLKVFISYSHQDEDWKNDLDVHLANMKRQGLINVWQDRKILPGDDWHNSIQKQLEESHIVLILLSAYSLNSEYIQEKEVDPAMALHREGKLKVVPIFVKHCEWNETVFRNIQGLPRDEKFLDDTDYWPSKEKGLSTVAKELRELIENWGK